VPRGGKSYAWNFAEVPDQPGIPGQGTASPASLFGSHQMTKIGGTYYDRSYGLTFTSLAQIDTKAVAGYLKGALVLVDEATVNLDLDGDGEKTDLDVPTSSIVIKANPVGVDLQESISGY